MVQTRITPLDTPLAPSPLLQTTPFLPEPALPWTALSPDRPPPPNNPPTLYLSRTAQNFALFFSSPATCFFLSSLSWWSFRGILVVFLKAVAQTPPPPLRKTPPNSTKRPQVRDKRTREDPQKEKKRHDAVAGEGKKSSKFWASHPPAPPHPHPPEPTLWGPTNTGPKSAGPKSVGAKSVAPPPLRGALPEPTFRGLTRTGPHPDRPRHGPPGPLEPPSPPLP